MSRAALISAALVALLIVGCATAGVPISEEDRCTRYGGIWTAVGCRQAGGGGGGGGGM